MTFGLKTELGLGLKTPSTFQRFINNILSDFIRVGDIVVYMDDMLVATTTLDHHLRVIKRFKVMVDNVLEMRLDKNKYFELRNDLYLGKETINCYSTCRK